MKKIVDTFSESCWCGSKCLILGIRKKQDFYTIAFPSTPPPPSFNVATLRRHTECKSQHCMWDWGIHFPLKYLSVSRHFQWLQLETNSLVVLRAKLDSQSELSFTSFQNFCYSLIHLISSIVNPYYFPKGSAPSLKSTDSSIVEI